MREYIKTLLGGIREAVRGLERRLNKVESAELEPLTFTGSVTGKYNGKNAVDLEIPPAPTWHKISDTTLTTNVGQFSQYIDLHHNYKRLRVHIHPPAGSEITQTDDTFYIRFSNRYGQRLGGCTFGDKYGLLTTAEIYNDRISLETITTVVVFDAYVSEYTAKHSDRPLKEDTKKFTDVYITESEYNVLKTGTRIVIYGEE